MLLAIDVGNTQTVFGLFDGDALDEAVPGRHESAHTADELAVLLRALVDLETLDGIVLCSSVPQLVREYEAFAERWAGVELLVLGPGVSTGVPIRYDDPREVGPDRIANAVAARERHGAPCVVVDFGTSTNFDVVSAAGEFAGGVLAPGIEISMDALFARAARLPKVPFVAPERVISQTTVAALQSGLVYGFAGQVDAIVDRIRDELGAPDAPVVATGGLAGADRAALADDHGGRPGADAARAPARLGDATGLRDPTGTCARAWRAFRASAVRASSRCGTRSAAASVSALGREAARRGRR